MAEPVTIDSINARSPFPWRHIVVHPTQPGMIAAEIKVLDARGVEVPIFALVNFAEIVSARLMKGTV